MSLVPDSVDHALDIAQAVASGERSAVDVLEQHLARVAQNEAEIHAFNEVLRDEAMAVAQSIDERIAVSGGWLRR